MKKFTFGAIALFAVAGTAFGSTTASTFANGWASVRSSGPVTGTSGERFLNIQGSGAGTFASYAAVRWDISGIRAQFDSAYGVNNWQVTGIGLDLWASNAAFTAPGDVAVYFSPDNTTNLTPGAADPSLSFDSSYGFGGNSGTTGVDGGYDRGSLVATFNFPFTGSGNNGLLPQIPLALNADIVDDILSDNNLSIVMEALSANVAATLKGSSFNNLEPPRIVITAEIIPAPGAAGLFGIAGLVAARRRRA